MKRRKKYKSEYLDSRLRGNDHCAGGDNCCANDRRAFTLVEILVVIAVVGILLALLIPALSSVQETAMKVKQRAQFHSIEVGLEGYYTDMGDYPPSKWDTTEYGNYSASQRLAEAMVGRDGFGFHPDSRFNEAGEDVSGKSLYMDHADFDTDYPNQSDKDDNLAARKGPYLELENANAVKLSNLYGAGNYKSLEDTFVLADVFKITKNAATGKMTGSPILYYRANLTKTLIDSGMFINRIYNVYDAIGGAGSGIGDTELGIASLAPLATKSGEHPLCATPSAFYKQIRNPNFSNPVRPYRAESFILQSAGPDSLYGTADDVFNFDGEL